jgi:hypothetical protein
MEERIISEKEFINYFKGLGGYCTYQDAFQDVQILLRTLINFYGIDVKQLFSLLPESIRIAFEKYIKSESVNDNFFEQEKIKKAFLTFFGTLKEKCASKSTQWRSILPEELKELWDISPTIDQLQEAGQCL